MGQGSRASRRLRVSVSRDKESDRTFADSERRGGGSLLLSQDVPFVAPSPLARVRGSSKSLRCRPSRRRAGSRSEGGRRGPEDLSDVPHRRRGPVSPKVPGPPVSPDTRRERAKTTGDPDTPTSLWSQRFPDRGSVLPQYPVTPFALPLSSHPAAGVDVSQGRSRRGCGGRRLREYSCELGPNPDEGVGSY